MTLFTLPIWLGLKDSPLASWGRRCLRFKPANFLAAAPLLLLLPIRKPRTAQRIAAESIAIAAWWHVRNPHATGKLTGLSESVMVMLRGTGFLTMLARA